MAGQPDTSPHSSLCLRHADDGNHGFDVQAHDALKQWVAQEAAVAAFQECSLLTAIVFILAMVPAPFIRPQRQQVWRKRR
jgi:hypothetical protein